MDDSKTYNDCLTKIRSRSITVEKLSNVTGGDRRFNKSKRKINNLKKKMSEFWVAPEKWEKMSWSKKDAHIKRAREAWKCASGGGNGNVEKHCMSVNKMTQEERDLYSFAQVNAASVIPIASTPSSVASDHNDEELTSHQIQFMNMVRSMNIARINVIKTVRTNQEMVVQQDMSNPITKSPHDHTDSWKNKIGTSYI